MGGPTSFQTESGLADMLRYAWDFGRPGLMVVLALGLAVLDARGPRRRRWSVAAAVAGWLLLGWVVWTIHLDPGQHPGRAARGPVRAGNAFHYVLGAKYLGQLGYTGLYPCVLAAWPEEPGLGPPDSTARDLAYYILRPSPKLALQCDRNRFTETQWTAFRGDVAAFVRHHPGLPDDEFRAELRDKGFNPPPTWALAVRPLVSGVDLAASGQRWVLALPDLLVFAGVLGLVAWRFGMLRSALVGLFLMLYFGTFRTLLGNVGQYLWLLPLVGAVVAVDARRMRLGGALLGLAAAFQVFPLVFAVVPAIRWGIGRLRGRTDTDGWRGFLVAAAAVAAAGVAVGALAFGPGIWLDFGRKMLVHTRFLSGEVFDIGWRNAVAMPGTAGLAVLDRLVVLDRRWWALLGGVAVALATVAAVAVRSRDSSETWVLGLVPFYFLTVASPYYYLSLVVAVLGRWSLPRLLAFALLPAHFLLGAYADRGFVDPENWAMHAWSEAFLLVFLSGVLASAWRRSVREVGPTPGEEAHPMGK